MTTLTLPANALWRDYFILLKPRVMSLVIFTALATLAIVPVTIHPLLAGLAILFLSLGAGAAGAFNQILETGTDALMHRTRNRPLPQGRLSVNEALTFAGLLAIFAVFNMGVMINWMAAGVLAFSIFFYVVVYTQWLKPRTPQNIVIGGLAGALPPVIIDLAVSGSLHWESVFLTGLVFFWTPPHFWALSLETHEDYARAGTPMLPVVRGVAATRRQILLYTGILVLYSLIPAITGLFGTLYTVTAVGLGVAYLGLNLALWHRPSENLAWRSFWFSIFYLFMLFSAAAIGGFLR